MNAVERLAAALQMAVGRIPVADPSEVAADILAADPTMAQDIEDGRSLRELREALPDIGDRRVSFEFDPEEGIPFEAIFWDSGMEVSREGHTFAEAAGACKRALVAR